MAYDDVLASYEKFDFTDGPWRRPVYRKGVGPAVIVIHEMPGLHPLVVRFADRVAQAGMTVFCPSLFGTPGKPLSRAYAMTSMLSAICIRRSLANAWISTGIVLPFGFSNSSAGPPFFTLRSANSVISSTGSTSNGMRFSSLCFSSACTNSRRSV